METTQSKDIKVLVVSESFDDIRRSANTTSFTLEFCKTNDFHNVINSHKNEIIVADNLNQEDLLKIISIMNTGENSQLFVAGDVENKKELSKVMPSIFFLDEKLKGFSIDKMVRFTRLRSSKILYKEENKSLKERLQNQKIMLTELEQTNNNLISATWRERDMKKKLKDAMDEIERSKVIIEQQNKRISESINYARKIQLAINPTITNVWEELPDSFILYKPKDVISGDFPWFAKNKQYSFIAAVDCTGHGVPGAMMSMIGNLLLNNIVETNPDGLPGLMLDQLHASVVETLKQRTSKSNSTDGMDIALLRVDKEKQEVTFASAHRPLILIRNGKRTEISGDRFPIGGTQYDKKRVPFKNTTISYEKGDVFMMFSDGLPDQIGGEEGRKFSTEQICRIAEENYQKSILELEDDYNLAITKWMGDKKQIDDILLIAIRF